MGGLKRILGAIKRAFGFVTTSFPLGGVASLGFPNRDTYAWLIAYRRNPRLRAAVRRIAKDCAKVRFSLMETGKDGKPAEVKSSPFLDWKKAPWQMLRGGTWETWSFLMTAWYVLVGNAYGIYRRDKQGRVVEVVPVSPHLVLPLKVTPNGGEPEMVFQVTVPGQEIPVMVPGSEMFWWRDPDLLNPLTAGEGQAQCLDDEIELDEAAAKFNLSYFRNQATPHVVVTVKGASPDQIESIKRDWRSQYGGVLNKFRSAFTSQDVAINEVGKSHSDMQFTEGRRFSRDAILQTFTLSPEIMGIVENSNRATADAALYIYSLNITLPLVTDLAAEVTRQILPQIDPAPKRFVTFENPVRETEEFKLRKATELFKAGAIRRDECRVTNGFDPIGGPVGDEIVVPTNTAPQGQMPTGQEPATKKEAPMSDLLVRSSLNCIIRAVDAEKRTVTAVVSNSQVDRYWSIILPSAFAQWMARYMENPVLCDNHQGRKWAVGRCLSYNITDEEVEMTFEFAPTDDGDQLLKLYSGGFMRGFSVGGMPHQATFAWDKEEKRNLLPARARQALESGAADVVYTDFELYEVSVATVPANPGAVSRAMVSGKLSEEFVTRMGRLLAERPVEGTAELVPVEPEPELDPNEIARLVAEAVLSKV